MTIEELLDDYDWAHVFGEEDDGNCDDSTDAIGTCPADPPPRREDVAEIICSRDGENDGESWIGVFRLKDGRYLFAEGGCDYTGWDCQASNSLTVAGNLRDLIVMGLSSDARREFADLVRREVRPAELADGTPWAVLADWHEEHGDIATAAMLRESYAVTEGF